MTPAATLLRALADYLREDVQGVLEGYTAYQNRVARNLLALLEREARYAGVKHDLDAQLASSLAIPANELSVRLARGLRDGELSLDSASLELVRQQAVLALAIDNPRYSGYRQARQRWPQVAAAVDAAMGEVDETEEPPGP
ncbi:MAG: DUF6285 domain-containing protein [Pseudomonadota bacterium]